MAIPITARALNLHPDHTKVLGTDQVGIAFAVPSDLEAAVGIGVRIKPTLAGVYTFSLAPSCLVDPTLANHLTRRSYVDGLVNNLAWKQAAAARSIGNLASLGGLLTLDGYTLLAGDRVLVMEQTAASANGLYIADASGWVRASDFAAGASASGATVHVKNGTLHANTNWVQTAEGLVNTVAQTWTPVQRGSTRFAPYTITAGDVTAKTATIPGVGGNIGANHLIFYNGIQLEITDATINTATGLLSWTGLSLDGRIAASDVIQVWGHV